MTNEERQILKAELMKSGFWDDEEVGDPTADDVAATALYYQMECLLREGVYLNFSYDERDVRHQELCVRQGDFLYPFPQGEDRCEAICLAALVLPKFLRLCPEFAAGPGNESLSLTA
jgi:hypothetical protein